MKEDSEDKEDQEELVHFRDKYAEQLRKRVDSGEILTAAELDFIQGATQAEGDIFPGRLKVQPIKYPRSPAQIAQARANLERINREKLQTGPRTPEGKDKSRRNAIRHGLYAQSLMSLFKPCFTTCPDYPCSLVQEDQTRPGDNCLEKQHFVEVLDAVEKAMRNKEMGALNDIIALEIASSIDMIRRLKEQVLHIGPLVKSSKTIETSSKNGDSSTIEHIEYKANPALAVLSKLIGDMGLTLADAMITPRELARHKIDEKAVETITERAARLGKRLMKGRGEDS